MLCCVVNVGRKFKMGRKNEEEPSGLQGFEALFPEITTVILETSEGNFPIIGANEMPMSLMAKFVDTPDNQKIVMMTDLIQNCLVNPTDWDVLQNLSVFEFNDLIGQWMQKSHANDED